MEQSLDSGTGTMATISTATGRYSRTSALCNSKQVNGANTTSGSASADHLSDVWPQHSAQHPPSPPVRQRARYVCKVKFLFQLKSIVRMVWFGNLANYKQDYNINISLFHVVFRVMVMIFCS